VISGVSTSEWMVLEVEAPGWAAESVASVVTEVTGRGVSLAEEDERTVITGYWRSHEAQAGEQKLRTVLAALAANLGMGSSFPMSVTSVAEEDWVGAWRDSYRPVRVGKRLVVKPSWHSWPPADDSLPAFDDDIVIEMDPQMAFGTGNHPTTQLCMEALEDLVRPGCAVADVGCGTGILSIVAARLGAGEVWAVDNDPLAVEIARDNMVQNSVAERVVVTVGEGLKGVERRFDVIAANISTPVIAAMSSDFAGHLAKDGAVAVSGIPTVRSRRVGSALRQAGLWVEQTRIMGSWVCVIARRRGGS